MTRRMSDDARMPIDRRRAFATALEALRDALVDLEALDDAELEPTTRKLRDNTRAMLDRYDRDAYDELVS